MLSPPLPPVTPGNLATLPSLAPESSTREAVHRHSYRRRQARGKSASTLPSNTVLCPFPDVNLRKNEPGNGAASLTLLSPKDIFRPHSRQPSNATTANTDKGVGPVIHWTCVSFPATSDGATINQDENFDPTPFAFKHYYLAFLVNPKSLETLKTVGRISRVSWPVSASVSVMD